MQPRRRLARGFRSVRGGGTIHPALNHLRPTHRNATHDSYSRQTGRDRSGHHLLGHRHARRARPGRHAAQPRRRDADPQCRADRGRQRRRRPGRARRGPGAACQRRHAHQALHGPSQRRPGGGRPRLPPRDPRRGDPAQAGAGRRAPYRAGAPGGHYRAGLLRRHAPQGHQGRRPHRRPGSARHPRRADRRRPGLLVPAAARHPDPVAGPGAAEPGTCRAGLRPWRRHLRRDAGTAVQSSLRVPGYRRRRAPGRQGLGRPHCGSRRRQVPGTVRRRPAGRRTGAGRTERRRGAGQAHAQQAGADERDLHARRQGADGAADARRLRGHDARPADTHPADDAAPVATGAAWAGATSTGYCWWAARRTCR